MSEELEGGLDVLNQLDLNAMRLELGNLLAVRQWAINSLRLNYEVGDRVEICTPDPAAQAKRKGSGWSTYQEGLAMGQSGVVREISFNEHTKKWQVGVAMDRLWGVLRDGMGRVTDRYWYGPEAEMPEGKEWAFASEKVKIFYFDVHWVSA